MKQSKYLKRWLRRHPAASVNQQLRKLLVHYIDFYPKDAMSGLSELVLDITALMDLVEKLEREKNIMLNR